MRIFSYLIFLVIMFIGLTFASLNSTSVIFNYYLGSRTIVLSLLLVFSFGGGLFLGMLVALFSFLKIKGENIRLKSKLKNAETEIENLRSIPIKER